jgi:molybdenum cofactor biosynthesis enzyme MoaA
MTTITPAPVVPLKHLDTLWFQIAGTICNYQCFHCFISCHPKNHTLEMLSYEEVVQYLEEAASLGVKEYYFTGGEPFLHPRMVDILELTLQYGPATVLTNASVLKERWLERLAEAEARSIYSLEFRVSLDGFTEQENDAIRGPGTFRRTLEGVRRLVTWGFLPIITAVRTWPQEQDREVVSGFVSLLRDMGYTRPRIKIIPALRIGAEAARSGSYRPDERVTPEMLESFDLNHLVCHSSRTITSRGVCVCPILVEKPEAVLGSTVAESLRPFTIAHGACWTCYQHGAICSNVTAYELESPKLRVKASDNHSTME